MTSSLDKAINIKHYLRVLWRRKGIIVLCAVLCFASTLVALEFVPKTFESQVTMMIEDSQLLSRELESVRGGIMESPNYYGLDEERMSKMIGRIRSRPFLERVIRILKMHEDPMIRSRAADELKKRNSDVTLEEMSIRILVENLQSRLRFGSAGKGIYKIIVADYSPENAQLIARWISEIFVDASNQRNIELIRSAYEFGGEQLKIYEQRLRRSEETLERYRQSVIQRDLRQTSVRPDNLIFAEALSRRVGDEAAMMRVRLKEYSEKAAATGMLDDAIAILATPGVRDLSSRLQTTLKNEVMNRLGEPSGDLNAWPPPGTYSNIRRTLLDEVELETSTRYPGATSDDVASIAKYLFTRLDLEAQELAVEQLTASIEASKARVESTPGGEIELARLEADVETNRRLLQSFQSQMVASDVSRAVEITKLGMQIEILDPANRPLSPSHPNRAKILLASLLLGPLIGAGMAFVGEAADSTLRTLDDFARVVPEPILGATPLLGRLTVRRRWIRRHWVPASVALVVLLATTIFVFRDQLLAHVWTKGTPVKVVSPDKDTNENQR